MTSEKIALTRHGKIVLQIAFCRFTILQMDNGVQIPLHLLLFRLLCQNWVAIRKQETDKNYSINLLHNSISNKHAANIVTFPITTKIFNPKSEPVPMIPDINPHLL